MATVNIINQNKEKQPENMNPFHPLQQKDSIKWPKENKDNPARMKTIHKKMSEPVQDRKKRVEGDITKEVEEKDEVNVWNL